MVSDQSLVIHLRLFNLFLALKCSVHGSSLDCTGKIDYTFKTKLAGVW